MKTRVLASVCCILVTISGFADSYTITLPVGISLIANQLDSTLPGGNTLDNVLPGVHDGDSLSRWDCTGWSTTTSSYIAGYGWYPGGTLNPGEGAMFINSGAAIPITFTGTPHVPVLPVVLPCGCNALNLLSRQTTNAPTTFQDLTGFAPTEGTSLRQWSGTGYTVYTFSGGAWAPSTPTLNLGESAFISVPCSNSPPCCPETGGVKYLQNPDLTNGIDVNATFSPQDPVNFFPWVLADDFPCTNSGPITDIHLWGSWLRDQVDYNAAYTLAIWSDVPTNTAGQHSSHPGQLLWTQAYTNGQYTLCPYTNQFENFYDGDSALHVTPSWLGSSSNLYYLCFDARPTNTFYQTGSPTAKTNYWLSVTVQSVAGSNYFGWKSSATAYNDAAVAAFSSFYPQPGDWYPMTDAQGLPLSLAFKITTATNTPPPDTNCCANCTTNNYVSYTNALSAGWTYLANNLCQGTNNTLGEVLPNMPDNTLFLTWNQAAQSYDTNNEQITVGGSWYDSSSGNPSTNTLAPGEGFLLNTPAASTLIIRGCEPTCPPPCAPTNGLSLVGRLGIGTATWTNLFSCPPPCGARMSIYNNATHDFANYDYVNGGWTPFEPVLAVGQPAFVSVQPNTNCCPTTNTLVLNTGYNQNSNTVYGYGQADAFWWVTADPTVPATYLPRPATVIQANPAWQPAQANSQWISSYPTEADNLNGEYDFETFFCVATNATNLVLNICLRADDAVLGAYLNGNLITLTPLNTTFGAPSPACGTVIVPSWFVPGLNVLEVRVTNIYAVAMGLNLEGSVTGTGLIAQSAPCCHPNSGISGQKFYDLNNNGVHDLGEPALSGWTIHLSNGATAVTDVNGYYYFLGLVPGTYTVTETVQAGWTQTAPAGGSYTVTLGAAQQINEQDFGNYHTNNTNCVHIACPSNIVAQCTGSGGAVVAYTVTATSLCSSNPVTVTCTPPSTSFFPLGTTVVVCTALDSLGNWATCSFTVTVVDTTPPVLACASNKTVSSGQAWSFDPPTASEACCTNLTIIVLNTVTNVSCNPCAINYTRTWQATDCSTNTATCSQTVTVIPTGPCQVFNTGMNGSAALGGGALDPNFVLVSEPIGAVGTSALVINPSSANTSYTALPDGPDSQWIGPETTLQFNEPSGVYHYQLQFLVCCTNGAELSGQMAADNTAGVYLNGTQVGSVSAASSFTSWTPISVTSGFVVCPLINVLDIYVTNYYTLGNTNSDSPTAFRAELTNCCCPLLVSCPSNKTVPCGTNWTFDLPVGSSCCGSNVTITWTGDVTNSAPCPWVITRTWLLTDACGNSNTCSQMVTVVNTNPPVLTCASNLTVSSGQVWNFTPPTASDACCTNLTIIVLNTVTNVSCNPCAIHYTRTWQAADCCTNTATCSQTVTVIPTGPCQVFNTGMNGTTALPGGALDPNFVLVDEPFGAVGTSALVIDPSYIPSSYLADGPNSQWIGPDRVLQFNEPSGVYHYQLQFLVCCTNGAELSGQMAADNTAGVYLNGTQVGSVSAASSFTSWTPVSVTSGFVVCPLINVLDIYVTNYYTLGNTNSDSPTAFRAELTNCCCPLLVSCPSNKTVPCGTNWAFDLPVGSSCCGSNVTITWTGDVTNSAPCPWVITRTWLLTDACGNSNTCSQTVTVVSCVPAPAGMVLWLPFDEASGTNTANLYAGGNSGVLVGGPSHNLGSYVDNSLCFSAFTGVDQYVSVLDYPAIDPGLGQGFTLDAWIQRAVGAPNSPSCVVLDKRDVNGNGYSLSVDYGRVYLTLSGNNYGDLTDAVPADGLWHFVAVTVSSGSSGVGEFYVDGHAPVVFAPAAVNLATTAPFLVGESVYDNHINNQPWQGCIDEVEMFNRALSSNEVTAIFAAGSAGKCKSPKLACSASKTVPCGSAWSFDPPKVVDPCCPSNQPPSQFGNDQTNGTACSPTITRTWLYVDCCGYSNFCSQTVTVVDTIPPTIHCQTNTVVVALNTNCQLVIPHVSASATDNCTSASLLVYSQSPPAGQVMPPGVDNCTVTITVTDLCGNSSHCYVKIVGVDLTPPVVTCPATMTVTNCLVPCVPVTATDNCCPPASLRITQSPPCNTPLGPGINSVTVTVTDCHGNSTTKVVRLVIVGTESFLGSLFNTGVDASKALRVPNGATDLHYTLGPVPAGTTGYVAPTAVVITNLWGWLEMIHVSEWIAPDLADIWSCPSGYYTYTNQFVLPAGANAASASISGRWAADDGAAMYFNGVLLPANGIPVLPAASGFNHWHSFTISSGFLAYSSENTILFVVTNAAAYSPGPTGLRVEYTSALVNCYTCAPPSIVWITPGQSLQEFSSGILHVTAAGTPPLSYQWYLNGAPLSNNGHGSGVTSPTLDVYPLLFSDAGLYTVVVSNPCGTVTNHVRLNVTLPWWWQWGWWNVAQLGTPLAATVGPDLSLVGTSFGTNYDLTAGTTEDFGLPNPGGQIVNVMDVAPLPADTSIQVPLIAAPGSDSDNSYTVIMDLYEPDTSLGTPSTLFQSISCCVSNLGSSGQDGVALTLDAANNLHLTGSAAGVPFDVASAAPLPVDAWNRVALVVDDPQDGVAVNLGLYLNGVEVGRLRVPPNQLSINWSNNPPTILSRQTNDLSLNAEFYVSSIQFHAVALSPAQLAGIGSPDNGPAPANDPSVGPQPVLSATVSGGVVSFSWSGVSPYVLQETTDPTGGVWMDSALPFTESQVNGNIRTTASAVPATTAPSKFYRLIFRP